MIGEFNTARRALVVTCVLVAICLPIAARIGAGPPGARVNVRWQGSIDAAARQTLEARYRLADGERLDGSTWTYDLIDPSPDLIRELVRDAAVDDTHHIDRSSYTLDGAERTGRRGRNAYGDMLVRAADGTAILFGAYAALLALVALSRMIPTHDLSARPRDFLLRAETHLFRGENGRLPYVVLAILGVAAYAAALWLPPTDDDDLNYLSSVATIQNPLSYFIQDHGHSNNLYRPLTPASIWLVYQVFGVWALPNQLINLALHIANALLLYRILQREQPDKTSALLVAAVFMISKYTWLAATWTSDRPMVLTGLFLLLFIDHLSQHDKRSGNPLGTPVRVSLVAAFSLLALMSKESGVVVPAVGLVYALTLARDTFMPRHRIRLAAITTSIVGLYVVFRILIFGSGFASYSQDGYMFLGLVHYEDSDDLPPPLRTFNYAENVVKNALAPVLPVFAEGGALLTQRSLLFYMPVIVSTALLFALTASRSLSRLQWIAVMIVLLNAVAHFPMFRFRLHYMSHAAFCLFVGSSPLLAKTRDNSLTKLAIRAFAVIAVIGGILWTSQMLDVYALNRKAVLDRLSTDAERHGPIVEQVLLRYTGKQP